MGRPEGPAGRPGRIRPGTEVELEVTDMGLDGDALGRIGDYVVLVPEAVPGERVRAVVVSSNRKLARARVARVVRPSPHRVAPRCRHFGPCGGCAWQHIAYAEQLRTKRRMLAALLERALGRPADVRPVLGLEGSGDRRDPEAPWGFRDKVHFVFGPGSGGRSLVMGHYRRGTRDVLEVEECPVHSEAGNRAALRAREALLARGVPGSDGEGRRGLARHIVVRAAAGSRDAHATLVATRETKGLAEATREIGRGRDAPSSLHLSVHAGPDPFLFGREARRLCGSPRLLETVAGARFLLSPRSFFQTSTRAAEKLAGLVLGLVPGGEPGTVLDLYAGAGLFAIPLALRGCQVVAVEESPDAVADGIASLRESRVPAGRCRFVRARVEDHLRRLAGTPAAARPPLGPVIMDPPRDGCPEEVWRLLLGGLRPRRVVYVSCNPRTLARDAALAERCGYRLERVHPVDMFPHTAHIESVALLLRG
ncbi:MAG: 23S rRNA (uracil(1939)-C(5))-methyltransferase RlmD [Planctomycetes bacterium]|nr:23S rRNA (uracil(1939)-C(5))-methyltransferase RlmD [Planctomycetota bacterium]